MPEVQNESLGFAVGEGRVEPVVDVLEAYGLAGLVKAARVVSLTVIRHDLPPLHAVAVEPSHSTAEQGDCRGQLLFCEHLHVGETRRVINGHVVLLVDAAGRAALLAVAWEATADVTEVCRLFDVETYQVSGMRPRVALDWRIRLEIPQPTQVKAIEHSLNASHIPLHISLNGLLRSFRNRA